MPLDSSTYNTPSVPLAGFPPTKAPNMPGLDPLSSLRLTWAPPFDNGHPITSYVLRVDDAWETAHIWTNEFVQLGLEQGAEHTYAVKAINALGNGTFSETVTLTVDTPETAPGFGGSGISLEAGEVLVPLWPLVKTSLLSVAFLTAAVMAVVFRKNISNLCDFLDDEAKLLASAFQKSKLTKTGKKKTKSEEQEREEAEAKNQLNDFGVLADGSLLGQYLHTEFVPGLDDADDITVNPVMIHKFKVATVANQTARSNIKKGKDKRRTPPPTRTSRRARCASSTSTSRRRATR